MIAVRKSGIHFHRAPLEHSVHTQHPWQPHHLLPTPQSPNALNILDVVHRSLFLPPNPHRTVTSTCCGGSSWVIYFPAYRKVDRTEERNMEGKGESKHGDHGDSNTQGREQHSSDVAFNTA